MEITSRRFRVGSWTVIPRASQLVRDDETVRLEPKTMEVLVCLARHSGEVVTRDELLEHAWGDTVVTDSSLTRAISKIRTALQDDPREPQYVETIPKVGYRLLAEVGDAPGETLPESDQGIPPSVPYLVTGGDGLTASTGLAPARPRTSTEHQEAFDPKAASSIGTVRKALVLAALLAATVLIGLDRLDRTSSVWEGQYQHRVLTTLPGTERHSTLSPDGSRLAFTWADAQGNQDIYVQSTEGTTPFRLTDAPESDQHPTWSPTGSRIAFLRGQPNGPFSVYLTNEYGSDERLLAADVASAEGLAWSPDGTHLAYVAYEASGASPGLFVLSLDTRTSRRLTRPSAGFLTDEEPMFSPDGNTITFVRRTDLFIGELYRVAVTGGPVRRLTNDASNIVDHTWTPNGEAILFASDRSGLMTLWRIDPDGGAPSQVSAPTQDPGSISSATTGALAVEDYRFDTNIWRVAKEGGERHRIAPSSRWDEQPALSPDGRRLAFVSTRSGRPELWLADSTASTPTQLTYFDGGALGSPQWSPDGRTLVFHAHRGANHDIYALDLEEKRLEQLTSDPAQDVHPRWSRDGTALYFGSNRGGEWVIWKLVLEEQVPRMLDRATGMIAEESPTGSHLYIATREGGGRFYALALNAQESSQAEAGDELPVLHSLDWANWIVTDAGLLYVYRVREGGSFRREIRRWSAMEATTVVERVGPLDYLQPALTASADGQIIAWSQIDALDNEVLLLEPQDRESVWASFSPFARVH